MSTCSEDSALKCEDMWKACDRRGFTQVFIFDAKILGWIDVLSKLLRFHFS